MSEDIAIDWWEKRRLKYNIAVVISGVVAFICYGLLLDQVPCGEVTLFTTAFQTIGYLILSNVCYCGGAYVENHFIGQQNVSRYRRVAFRAGLWFSVLLPFTIPAIVALEAALRVCPNSD